MMRSLLPISALLLGSALLLIAGGMHGLVLPVRGAEEGFSAFSLGLLGTGWAVGYVTGCLRVPGLVARVGHVRAFGVMAALAAVSILLSLLLLTPYAWIPLRALAGFCFAGAAMIVESWLNERTDESIRGRVFGLYSMINLVASTAGQLALTVSTGSSDTFFVLGAVFYCLALVPMAISSSQTPKPLVAVRMDIGALWRNSPVAVFGVLMVGISNSAFGTLSAVYADSIGLALTGVALFASIPVLAGAVAQVPVGILSDRHDRRVVLLGVSVTAMVADLLFIIFMPAGLRLNLAVVSVHGAAIFAMYPVIIAHANDKAAPGTFIQTSGGLLMIFGVGSIVGPLFAGAAMQVIGPRGLFLNSAVAHLGLIGFILWRIRVRIAPAAAQKSAFRPSAPVRNLTPETAALAVRGEAPAAGPRDAQPAPPAPPSPGGS